MALPVLVINTLPPIFWATWIVASLWAKTAVSTSRTTSIDQGSRHTSSTEKHDFDDLDVVDSSTLQVIHHLLEAIHDQRFSNFNYDLDKDKTGPKYSISKSWNNLPCNVKSEQRDEWFPGGAERNVLIETAGFVYIDNLTVVKDTDFLSWAPPKTISLKINLL